MSKDNLQLMEKFADLFLSLSDEEQKAINKFCRHYGTTFTDIIVKCDMLHVKPKLGVVKVNEDSFGIYCAKQCLREHVYRDRNKFDVENMEGSID